MTFAVDITERYEVLCAAAEFAALLEKAGTTKKFLNVFTDEYRAYSTWAKSDKMAKEVARVVRSVSHRAATKGGKLVVYRCLIVESVEKFKDNPSGNRGGVGVFWSYTKAGAQCYWGEHRSDKARRIVVVGLVDLDAVDPELTLTLNVMNKLEAEVRLKNGAKVHALKILTDDGEEPFSEVLTA